MLQSRGDFAMSLDPPLGAQLREVYALVGALSTRAADVVRLFGPLVFMTGAAFAQIPAPFSESLNAAAVAAGSLNFYIGRMARDCQPILEEPQSFIQGTVSFWQKNNGVYVRAAIVYLGSLTEHLEKTKGKEFATAVQREAIKAVRTSAIKLVSDFTNKHGIKEACTRFRSLVRSNAYDITSAHPLYSDLKELVRVTSQN